MSVGKKFKSAALWPEHLSCHRTDALGSAVEFNVVSVAYNAGRSSVVADCFHKGL